MLSHLDSLKCCHLDNLYDLKLMSTIKVCDLQLFPFFIVCMCVCVCEREGREGQELASVIYSTPLFFQTT
jgi:hypothetical protein